MKQNLLAVFAAVLSLVMLPAVAQTVAPAPALMNFQGRLAKPDGTPLANGTYAVRFSLWDNAATPPGAEKWNQTQNVVVRNGTFAVLLGSVTPFPAALFNGNVWLEVKVGSDVPLTPRQQIVSVAFALKANSVADNSITNASIANATITASKFAANTLNPLAWLLGGNSGTNPAANFLGTTDNQPLELRVNNKRALRITYVENVPSAFHTFNFLGGADANSIKAGVYGATIAGGGSAGGTDLPNIVNSDYGFLGGGLYNTIETGAANGVIGGGFQNTINPGAISATIAGGEGNTVSTSYGFVGGGQSNGATGLNAFVGGGIFNITGGANAVVAGGYSNLANAAFAAILGGNSNFASGQYSVIVGGNDNTASGEAAFIGGGTTNQATRIQSTVSGGLSNRATGDLTTIGGGEDNAASAAYATIGGGVHNIASLNSATVGGGVSNKARGPISFIGGGADNIADGRNSTVAGGIANYAFSDYSAVGGGNANEAAGTYSTVPGGYYNYAGAIGSFAAGVRAVALNTGSFVWADNHDVDFNDTAENQFCIRAYGGLLLEMNRSSFIYTGSTAGEKNRYLELYNSPQTPSASGLRAGGILCADSYGYANPGKNDLIVKGKVSIGYTGPTQYTLAVNGSTFSLNGYSGSDARYKKNIATLNGSLESLLALRGVSYEWDKAKFPGQNFGDGRQMGFIAQEIEKIFPELVVTAPDGYKAVNYVGVIPVAIEAIKALNGKADTLQKENAELKARLARLEAAVEKLQDAHK